MFLQVSLFCCEFSNMHVILFWTALHAVEDFLCLYQSVAEPEDRAWGNVVWGAVDTTPDSGVKVSSTPSKWLFDITGRPTRTELERVFCRWIYIYLHSKIFSGPLSHGGGRSPPSPHMDPPLISVGWSALNIHRSLSAGDCVRYAMQMNSSFVILNSSFVLEA